MTPLTFAVPGFTKPSLPTLLYGYSEESLVDRMRAEVTSLQPVQSLPCYLSDEWIDILQQDCVVLQQVMRDNGSMHGTFAMAYVYHMLDICHVDGSAISGRVLLAPSGKAAECGLFF